MGQLAPGATAGRLLHAPGDGEGSGDRGRRGGHGPSVARTVYIADCVWHTQRMTYTVISVDGLIARYGDLVVLDHLTLDIGPGVLALLGPNGAGKTTLVDTVTTLRRPDAGRVRVLGHDVVEEARGRPRPARGHRPAGECRRRAHRAREPRAHRPAARPGPGRRPSPRRRAARAVRPRRAGRPPGGHLVGWDAPPAGPRGEPRDDPARAGARRADDRSGRPLARAPLGGGPRRRRRRDDRAAHDPVPRGGRRARRPGRRPGRWPGRRRRHPRRPAPRGRRRGRAGARLRRSGDGRALDRRVGRRRRTGAGRAAPRRRGSPSGARAWTRCSSTSPATASAAVPSHPAGARRPVDAEVSA